MRAVRIAMVSLALAAAQVHAGIFDDEEARKSIAATQARLDGLSKTLDARMTTLEQQSKQLGFDLLRDLEGIKSDIAKIRGQIEVLTYELNEQQKRQRDLYVDLDTRMRKMETAQQQAQQLQMQQLNAQRQAQENQQQRAQQQIQQMQQRAGEARAQQQQRYMSRDSNQQNDRP